MNVLPKNVIHADEIIFRFLHILIAEVRSMAIVRVKQIRTRKDISLRELEELSGLSKSAISRIERGEVSPTLYELELIANALKINPYYLFKFTKE